MKSHRTRLDPPGESLAIPLPARIAAAAAVALAAIWLGLGCAGGPAPEPPPTVAMPLFAHPGACSQCHDAMRHGVPVEVPEPNRCATPDCHPSLEKSQRFVHGPVAVGDCRACHRQHSAVERHLLARPATTLCLGCHDQLVTCPAASQAADSPCVSCHDPHGGPSHLLRPAVADLPPAGR
jgi:predicted CXXCH cytochrome family protein